MAEIPAPEPPSTIGSIVISGQGSAHPTLGVKKKHTLEENIKILDDMITTGKLSLDHAIAKTAQNGSLRGHFGCKKDEAMDEHVDALNDFVVDWKRRLVPGYDPAAEVPKKPPADAPKKPFSGSPPVLEQAKTGRSTCKQSGQPIEAGAWRCGLPTYVRGHVGTAWSKAEHFSKALRFERATDNRSKCKASGEKITAGTLRICARIGSFAELAEEGGKGGKSKTYYLPDAIADFLTRFAIAARVSASDIEGFAALTPEEQEGMDKIFTDGANVA